MITVYVGVQAHLHPIRIKAVIDRDSLPPDVTKVQEFVSSGSLSDVSYLSRRFWKFYEQLRFIEHLGMEVCIDFGKYFYETGGEVEISDDRHHAKDQGTDGAH